MDGEKEPTRRTVAPVLTRTAQVLGRSEWWRWCGLVFAKKHAVVTIHGAVALTDERIGR